MAAALAVLDTLCRTPLVASERFESQELVLCPQDGSPALVKLLHKKRPAAELLRVVLRYVCVS